MARAVQAPLQYDLEDSIRATQGGKAVERAFLESIQDVIDKAAKESATRETLKSTVEMRKRLQAEERQRKDQELAAAISIVAAKEKEKGARKNAPVDNGPTPERKAKLLGVEEVAPPIGTGDKNTLSRAHLTQGVVEFYRGKWKPQHQEGAAYLLFVGLEAGRSQRRITGTYDGAPSTSFGPRSGGVAAHMVEAHTHAVNVKAMIAGAFGAEGVLCLEWLWGEVKVGREGASLGEQMADLGRHITPWLTDREGLRRVSLGHLIAMFRFTYGEWLVKERGMRRRESSPEQIAMRRAQRIKRMQDQGLLRADRDGPAFKNGGKG